MTCAQLQLNLRTAVQRVPEYATTYFRQPSVFDGIDGRLNSPHRPGADTLMLDSTATGPEHKHRNSSVENEVEQRERHYSSTIELTTTATYTPQRTTGQEMDIASSVDLESGERASSPHQPQWEDSSQCPPSHSSVDIIVIPNSAPDETRYPSPTSSAHSEPSGSGLSTRFTRMDLGVDSGQISAQAEATSSSNSSAIVAISQPED